MALTRRRLVLALVRFAGLIVVLLLPWPGLDTAFVRAYAFVADRTFAGWVGGNLLQVHLFPSPDHIAFLSWNAEVTFVSKAGGTSLYIAGVDCWRAVYLPQSGASQNPGAQVQPECDALIIFSFWSIILLRYSIYMLY